VDSQRAAPGAKIETALRAASLSPNRVRKVGAVLVVRDGTEIAACNTFPAGVRDLEERHAGDGRFIWMEHAERHAIFDVAWRRLVPASRRRSFRPSIALARSSTLASRALTRLSPISTIRSGARRLNDRKSS
jgi:dCMP deaminase